MQLVGSTYWDQRGKIDGLMYVISDYSDIAAFALIVHHGRQHGLGGAPSACCTFTRWSVTLLIVGGVVYLALPRIMFDTYMTDQRVPLGVAFMLFGCGDLELRRRLVRRAFMVVLIVLITARLIEIDFNWSQLSDSTSEFRSSVRRIAPGSKVFVAYADRSLGEDVRDLGLVHAACIATIERSALVTTLFTVAGKQVMHVRPEYRDFADCATARRPRPRSSSSAAEHPAALDAGILAELDQVRLSLRAVHRGRGAQSRSRAPQADRRRRPFPALPYPQATGRLAQIAAAAARSGQPHGLIVSRPPIELAA